MQRGKFLSQHVLFPHSCGNASAPSKLAAERRRMAQAERTAAAAAEAKVRRGGGGCGEKTSWVKRKRKFGFPSIFQACNLEGGRSG